MVIKLIPINDAVAVTSKGDVDAYRKQFPPSEFVKDVLASTVSEPKFDRVAWQKNYMRTYMREWRRRQKQKREAEK